MGTLVQAIEKQTGIGFAEIVSRRRGEALRRARGVLVVLAREVGYTLTDLQTVLKREVSVVSRLATVGETTEGQRLLRKTRKATKCIIASLTMGLMLGAEMRGCDNLVHNVRRQPKLLDRWRVIQ